MPLRARAASRLAALATGALVTLATTAGAGPAPAPAAAVGTSVALSVDSVTPTVARQGQRVTVRGRVRNTGSSPLANPRVDLVLGPPATDRAAVASWAGSDDPADGATLTSTRVRTTLAPGTSAAFRLTLPRASSHLSSAYGALPVSVQSGGDHVHTFIGAQSRKEYEPLGVTWVVPLTPSADPALVGPASAARTAAWSRQVGPRGRLRSTLEAGRGRGVVWAVDDNLLATAATGRRATEEEAAERAVRASFRTELRSVLATEESFRLPAGDADVAAATTSQPARTLVRDLIDGSERGTGTGPADPADPADPAPARVLWPADGVISPERERALDLLAPEAPVIVAAPVVATGAAAPDAAARTEGGTTMLLTDPGLDALAAGPSGDRGTLAQRLVAETAAIVAERAGSTRSVLVTLPRGGGVDDATMTDLLSTAADVPWLRRATLAETTARAAKATPTALPDSTQTGVERARSAGVRVPAPPLGRVGAQRLLDARTDLDATTSVRADAATIKRSTAASVTALASARWRGHRAQWQRGVDALTAQAATSRSAIKVSADDVNFFADSGRLQVTLRNTLPAEVKDVHVELQPANPRLSIDEQPEPVTIGAGSRQVVTVQARAHGPGQVPIAVDVTTPEGARIAEPTALRVKVAPTGNGIYWVIGAGSLALVAAGTWRTLRRGRAARQAGQGPTRS